MSITYGDLNQHSQSWILHIGQLIRIKHNCFEQIGSIGIIIECIHPDFGTGVDQWLVLSDGKLNILESFRIWPIEEI